MLAAKWAACVHADFGNVRSMRPLPMAAIASSESNALKDRMSINVARRAAAVTAAKGFSQ